MQRVDGSRCAQYPFLLHRSSGQYQRSSQSNLLSHVFQRRHRTRRGQASTDTRSQRRTHPPCPAFCGPEGVGKFPLALAYARYLSCTNRSDTDACGVCPSCVKFNKLVHPDVHFVFPVVKNGRSDDYIVEWRKLVLNNPYFTINHWLNEINAENAQAVIYTKESDEIMKKLSLKSSEGGFKITLLWLPEKMQQACANKLLKLLEEPPEKTIFLLVSETPDLILQTILSRTQRFNLRKIEEECMAEALQSKYGVQQATSISIAHLANGNFIKALETIHLNEENQLFFELFVSLMRLSYQRKIREMKLWSEQVAGMGRERQKLSGILPTNDPGEFYLQPTPERVDLYDIRRTELRYTVCPFCQRTKCNGHHG